MDLNKRIYFEWSTGTIVLTVVFALIIIAVLIAMFRHSVFNAPIHIMLVKIIGAAVLLAASFFILRSTPRYLTYDETGITLKTILSKKKFAKDDIIAVEGISGEMISQSTRRFGSGGVGGFTGLFYNSQLGNYRMYVTKKEDLVLLTLKDGKYVMNCSRRDDLIEFVQKHYLDPRN